MKILLRLMMVASLTCFIGACSLFATTDRNIPTETQIIENQNNIPLVGNFNDRVNSLAEQLHKNAAPKTLSNTYIITSFSNLDKLNHTTALGRLISENLMHGLQVHKWNILEIRLTKGIDVNAAGEFSLSRDVSKLKDEYKISGVVAGTYSVAEGNLTINARVIDVNTGLLISSAQTYIPVNWIPDVALSGDNGSKSMKITSDGIK